MGGGNSRRLDTREKLAGVLRQSGMLRLSDPVSNISGAIAERLGDNLCNLLDIVYGWGFNDVSHFNRAFKARFGVTPGEMRAQAMGANLTHQ